MKRAQSTLLVVLFFAGCGYKPAATHLHNEFGQKIYLQVHIDASEPDNAPFVNDAVRHLIYDYFGAAITSKKRATTQLSIDYHGSDFYPIAYDKNGYTTRYRVTTNVDFTLSKEGKEITKRISTIDEADVHASALSSSTLRIQALRKGIRKALDRFLAYAIAQGIFTNAQ